MANTSFVAQALTATSTVPLHTLGETYWEDGAQYIYLKGVASTAQYDAVTYYPADWTTQRLTKAEVDKLYPVAIAQSANVANQYGWYQIKGKGSVNALASIAKEVAIYTSGTAGSVDDSSSSQTKLVRFQILATDTTAAANVASCFIDYPSAV